MADGSWRQPQHGHDVAADPSARLDAKKRTVVAAEADAAERAVWWTTMAAVNPAQVVFIDESGTNVTATPRYGWAPKGVRARGAAPRNYDQNTTLVAALTTQGITGALSFPGALDSEAFDLFLDRVLVPRLEPGQTVIMDNLSVHRRRSVRTRLEAAQLHLVYLPAYSPDFNPIEHAFSKLKTYLRRLEARTQHALDAALSTGLAMITPANAQGWIRHCGYALPRQPL
jgi:transposase